MALNASERRTGSGEKDGRKEKGTKGSKNGEKESQINAKAN
jgi:hypothetical protein